jgi:hypothetical protein
LINKLRNLQYSLPLELRSDAFLYNKIILAYQGHPAYIYALIDPPSDISALINRLQSLISIYEKENPLREVFYTDRRFYLNNTRSRPY